MKNIIGERIQVARKLSDPPLTQADLVARLQLEGWHISRGTLAKIESGIRQVTDIEVLKLSKALNISPSWLLENRNPRNSKT